MTPTAPASDLETRLARFHQSHVLRFWNELSPDDQARLRAQLEAIDLELIAKLHQSARNAAETNWRQIALECSLPTAVKLRDRGKVQAELRARELGEAALADGKVAVVLVAGGQATRLGSDRPKGLYPIGPVSEASLFQIFFEMILAKRKRYGAPIPLFIMTSEATHAPTAAFLEANRYFGLPSDEVTLFQQGVMPAVDLETGKLLLADKGKLALSPDGHGGVLGALAASGSFNQMRARGVEQIFFFQVDNPLVHVCEPEMIGLHLAHDADLTTKVIAKETPDEKLGAVVARDGRLMILEYSDLPADLAARQSDSGEMIFWAGSIAVHVFRRAFLERIADAASLPFHFAFKKTPYLDENGVKVAPTANNSIKFERFIFDVFPEAERGLVVETGREDEYAAVKNASGDYSPASVREQMLRVHGRWVREAGHDLPADRHVEFSPLAACEARDVKEQAVEVCKVSPRQYVKGK